MDQLDAADLRQVPLFASLPDHALTRLAPAFEIEEYPSGRTIVREGEAGYAFYVIGNGSVAVTQNGRELRTLSAGDYFGEISIEGTGRRTASVTATSDVELWVLFGADFRALESSDPEVASLISEAIATRLGT